MEVVRMVMKILKMMDISMDNISTADIHTAHKLGVGLSKGGIRARSEGISL